MQRSDREVTGTDGKKDWQSNRNNNLLHPGIRLTVKCKTGGGGEKSKFIVSLERIRHKVILCMIFIIHVTATQR